MNHGEPTCNDHKKFLTSKTNEYSLLRLTFLMPRIMANKGIKIVLLRCLIIILAFKNNDDCFLLRKR